MTAALIIRYRVANFEVWKSIFDSMATARLAHGWTSTIVFRDAVDPNLVTVVNRVKDLDGAKRYAGSAELHRAMQNAGVQGVPEIIFAQEVDEWREPTEQQATKPKEDIMSALDLVKKLDKEISGGDLKKAGEYLAEDFRFVGVSPQPLGRAEALGVWTTLRAGMPDFNHNLRDLREAANIVYGVVEVTGSHTGTLAIPHGPTLPATGRKLQNPRERVAITVRNDKVTEWSVEQVPGGGISGVLGQLG